MTKTEAKKLLGVQTDSALGRILNGRSRQVMHKWPEILTEDQECIVLGKLEQIKRQPKSDRPA